MSKRLPLLFHHVMYNLRGGFPVRPLLNVLVLGCAGAFCPGSKRRFILAPKVIFPSNASSRAADLRRHQCIDYDGGIHRLRHPADDAHPGINAVLPADHSWFRARRRHSKI